MVDKKKDCTGCGACAAVCPKACISMIPDQWGFLYPQVNTELCVNCGLCDKACSMGIAASERKQTISYGVCNLKEDVRKNSSSGGVFTILAEYVIENGGVVFGAAFDEQWGVAHTFSESIQELGRFRGAKYVQSKIGNSYQQAKAFLQEGKLVLFSGTPCQIGGLKAYLGSDYENLICQDVICHGVPAPGIWKRYTKELEQKWGSLIQEVTFRSKKRGWKNYVMAFKFQNGKVYQNPPALDPYMRAFLSDLSLRPSCFVCRFKGISRQADITLADFWGIQQVQPEMDDNKGISLVLVHSEKGNKLIDVIQKKAKMKQVDTEKAIHYNPSAVRVACKPDCYNQFMKLAAYGKVSRAVERYARIPFMIRVKLEVYELMQRINDKKY